MRWVALIGFWAQEYQVAKSLGAVFDGEERVSLVESGCLVKRTQIIT